MADSVDLVVLGGYFGTGANGGLVSVFLMGCYDEESKIWKTVSLYSFFFLNKIFMILR